MVSALYETRQLSKEREINRNCYNGKGSRLYTYGSTGQKEQGCILV
jgi:hypothetical protein